MGDCAENKTFQFYCFWHSLELAARREKDTDFQFIVRGGIFLRLLEGGGEGEGAEIDAIPEKMF